MSFLSICFLRSFSNLRRVWKGGTAVADLLALLATSTGRQRCWQSGVRGVSGRTSGQEGGSLHRWVVQSHGGVQNFVNAHPDARPPGCNDARSLSHCDVDQGFRSGTTQARQVGREHLKKQRSGLARPGICLSLLLTSFAQASAQKGCLMLGFHTRPMQKAL